MWKKRKVLCVCVWVGVRWLSYQSLYSEKDPGCIFDSDVKVSHRNSPENTKEASQN